MERGHIGHCRYFPPVVLADFGAKLGLEIAINLNKSQEMTGSDPKAHYFCVFFNA